MNWSAKIMSWQILLWRRPAISPIGNENHTFFKIKIKKPNSYWSSRISPRKRPGSSKTCLWVSWTRKLVGRIGKPTKCLNWWTPIFVLILKCTIVGINELDLLITDFYEGAWPLTCIQNGAIRFCDHLANVGFKDLWMIEDGNVTPPV